MLRLDTSIVARALSVALLALGTAASGCAANEAVDDAEPSAAAIHGQRTFLEEGSFADLVRISPSFPFGVTARHAAAGPALGARWGAHGGPLVTTQNFSAPGSALKVQRYSLPSSPTEAVSKRELTSGIPSGLPRPAFWGADGFVDSPSGSLAMHAYTTSGGHFAGEAVFFSKDYDAVIGRAKVNGYYSGAFVLSGADTRLVYSGLSPLSTTSSATHESGLYASNVCEATPGAEGPCTATVKLFGWQGNSGPVTADADGNVFVAAFLTGSASSDPIYGITQAQSLSRTAVEPTLLAQKKTGGTASIAAVTTPGSGRGWILAKGHDGDQAAPSYAVSYRTTQQRVDVDGQLVEKAIVGASPDVSVSFFADGQGHLWVAVERGADSFFLELSPKS